MNKKVKFNQDEKMEGMQKRIKSLRKSLRYTQSQMGEMLGVSAQTVSGYESGTIIPGPEALLCYCDIFKVDCNYLLMGIQESATTDFSFRDHEKELILSYRKLSIKKQDALRVLLDREGI